MNYLQYLFKSKGRHGTHSPFVYTFVEEALHRPKGYVYPPGFLAQTTAAQQTLFRIISFLDFEHWYGTPDLKDALGWLNEYIPKGKCLDSLTDLPEHTLIIARPEALNTMLLAQVERTQYLSVLLWHEGNPAYQEVVALCQQEVFQCTLFTWDCSLLIRNPDFKRKQHYLLR
ncbi:hypothetical protein DBR32_15070 [Taibaiella sp. KBW10]|uniref:hypothetical protein n=1 Tax=Taibaiella sp. KBW10 TaxID=2153357 RepID=UPI000F5A0948|nr:hypothetical protein [Taibaiella sp. KBW10]RQO29895.1 hypothetical protein DBR32_15070 [Taibaiella sp. KBW10]